MWQNLRYAVRLLRRRPGASALVVGTLTIGIAATTIVFSLADAILWHPLPFRHADRLVRVRTTFRAGQSQLPVPLDSGAAIFDGIYPFRLNSAILEVGGEPLAVTVGEIAPGLLPALGVAPMWGREFTRAEHVPGSPAVMISDGLWRRYRAAAGSADDQTIRVDGVSHTIVGVMPPGFEFPVSRVELWRPIAGDRAIRTVTALGVLKRDVTLTEAQAFADAARSAPGSPFSAVSVAPFVSVAGSTATAIRVLFGAVALLLLIAVFNAATIVQAETVRREAELAVRASLGASWPRLVRQLTTETLVVSAIAAALAVLVSIWMLAAVVDAVPYLMSFQALRPIGIDWRAILFASGTAMAAGAGASWLAAVRAMGVDLQRVLRGQSSGVAGHERVRAGLTAAQIAITLVLLTGAGLLGNGFLRLSRVDPGFAPEHLVSVELHVPAWRYAGEAEIRAALERLRDAALQVPDVAGATISHSMPPSLGSRPLDGLITDDGPLASTRAFVSTGLVDGAFFTTLGIPLVSGRTFDDRDRDGALPVAVVSRSFAARMWPSGDPIGRRFRASATDPWLTVVGVAGDVTNGGFDQALGPLAYYTARAQSPTWWYVGLIARTRSAPERAVPALRSLIHQELPDAPVVGVVTGEASVANANGRVRFATMLMMAFSGVALAVALIGIYGAFWSTVSQRTREIGVRMALGAAPIDVLRMVFAGSARVLAIGLAAGTLLSLAATRLLRSLLFEVSPDDPPTFAAVTAFLAVAALAATYLPARRAASVDPVTALRAQ